MQVRGDRPETGVVAFRADFVVFGVLLTVLAVIALVDLGWVIHRKRRGEPG